MKKRKKKFSMTRRKRKVGTLSEILQQAFYSLSKKASQFLLSTHEPPDPQVAKKRDSWIVHGLFHLGHSIPSIQAHTGLPQERIREILSKPDRRHMRSLEEKESISPRKRSKGNLTQLDQWQMRHPAIPLPESVLKIQALTGLSRSTIYNAIRKRKEVFTAWVQSLGSLQNPEFFFIDEDGKRFFHRFVSSYSFLFNPFTNKTIVQFKTVDGAVHLMPIENRLLFKHIWQKSSASPREDEEEGKDMEEGMEG